MYLTGTTSFYSRLPFDPWQRAHDNFSDQVIGLNSESPDYWLDVSIACENLVGACRGLVERYRPFSIGATEPEQITAFYAVDAPTAIAKIAEKHRECICGERSAARITRHPQHGVGLYCYRCVPEGRKK